MSVPDSAPSVKMECDVPCHVARCPVRVRVPPLHTIFNRTHIDGAARHIPHPRHSCVSPFNVGPLSQCACSPCSVSRLRPIRSTWTDEMYAVEGRSRSFSPLLRPQLTSGSVVKSLRGPCSAERARVEAARATESRVMAQSPSARRSGIAFGRGTLRFRWRNSVRACRRPGSKRI